ncbi:MAG TPA: PIN domain-containing protein [Lacipirellulaceae bacterium]|nr:PIN domain-containing protein [Lacipirellulaceae bacterium]
MKQVFVDASGLIGVLNTRDQWHARASELWAEFIDAGTPLVTTTLVLIELADALARCEFRRLAVEARDRLLQWEQVDVVVISPLEERRAWDLYRDRSDKAWGMTDCTSMIVMQDRHIAQVLTADRHFEQAGFETLLKTRG